jgi:cell division protein FtsZ
MNTLDNSTSEYNCPVIKVMGLGGGGCNTIDRMAALNIPNIELIAANTDQQTLAHSLAATKIQLGPECTHGLGAGGDPCVGEAAAEESFRELSEAFKGADLVFLTAGMGGGTGTGAIPIAARIAQSLSVIVVSIVTLPFRFEFGRRLDNANEGLAKLRPYSDTLITVPNDRLLQIAAPDLPLDMAFQLADDVLRQGIQGISELITKPGLMNVDFAHIRRLMSNGGGSYLAIGQGEGKHKAMQALDQALTHPLLDDIDLDQATGIIANFRCGKKLSFSEVANVMNALQHKTRKNTEIIPGIITDDSMGDRVELILIVTGIGATPIDTPFAKAAVFTPVESKQKVPKEADRNNVDIKQKEEIIVEQTMDIPAFLRKRQIPLELMQGEYGRKTPAESL